jgi:hypothetical protein
VQEEFGPGWIDQKEVGTQVITMPDGRVQTRKYEQTPTGQPIKCISREANFEGQLNLFEDLP